MSLLRFFLFFSSCATMPLLSSSLSLLPLPPAFRPFSSFRFADDLRVFRFFGFSLFSSGLYPFPRSQNGSPPVTGRSTFPYGGQIFGSGRRPSSGPRHLTKTVRSRVSFTISHNTLSKGAGMTPSSASGFAISDSDVAFKPAAEAGSRSTFSTASGGGPVRGVPRDVAGTDQFGEGQRCRSSGGRRHATSCLGTNAPRAARAGAAFGETSCARSARVRY